MNTPFTNFPVLPPTLVSNYFKCLRKSTKNAKWNRAMKRERLFQMTSFQQPRWTGVHDAPHPATLTYQEKLLVAEISIKNKYT